MSIGLSVNKKFKYTETIEHQGLETLKGKMLYEQYEKWEQLKYN